LKDATMLKIVSSTNEPVYRTKILPLNHPLMKYLVNWWREVPKPDDFIFPPSQLIGPDMEGPPLWSVHMHRGSIVNVLRKYKVSNWWSHLFRGSLATNMAAQLQKEGKDPLSTLLDWFDWVNPVTAREYIEMGKEDRVKIIGEDMTKKLFQ